MARKGKKRWEMTNKNGRTWNMVRKTKKRGRRENRIMASEKHTL